MKKIMSVLLVTVFLMGTMPVQAYEFKDNDTLVIDLFDQGEDTLKQWFEWLPMDTLNHKTYHDMLKNNFAETFHELIIPFDIGMLDVNETQSVLEKYNLYNGLGKIYYLDEIQQTFNETYNTDIDMAALDGLTMGDNHVLVKIIDNYFIVMQTPHGTNVNPKPKSVCRLGENSEYWTWYYQDEWNTNDDIYTIISYKNVVGYDVQTIDYIGFTPPSDELLASYEKNVESDITVFLNEEKIEFDQPPIIKENRTLVPLRGICEAMGCNVKWNADTKLIEISNSDVRVLLTVDSPYYMYQNSELYQEYLTSDVTPMVVNDRTLVPARLISETLGADVEWDGVLKRVKIYYKGDRGIVKNIYSRENYNSQITINEQFLFNSRTYELNMSIHKSQDDYISPLLSVNNSIPEKLADRWLVIEDIYVTDFDKNDKNIEFLVVGASDSAWYTMQCYSFDGNNLTPIEVIQSEQHLKYSANNIAEFGCGTYNGIFSNDTNGFFASVKTNSKGMWGLLTEFKYIDGKLQQKYDDYYYVDYSFAYRKAAYMDSNDSVAQEYMFQGFGYVNKDVDTIEAGEYIRLRGDDNHDSLHVENNDGLEFYFDTSKLPDDSKIICPLFYMAS